MPEWSDSEVAVDTDVSSPADQPMAPSGNCPPSAELHAPYAAEPSHRRRAASAFIFVTITLDMLAMGMIAPVLPKLITGFMGGNEASGAEMFGIFGTVWAVMQFGFSPLLGSLSDRFGRRPIVLLSNFGLGIDYLVMALAPTLGWLFVGRVVSGITSASVPTAMAYIADVTDPKKRAEAFGMVSAAFGLGFVLGPALGGVLGKREPATSLLGGGRDEPAERHVRVVCAAGVPEQGISRDVLVETGESTGVADPIAAAP